MIEQILEFIQNHWILCGSSALLVIMLILEEIKGKASGLSKLSTRDMTMLLNREDASILDLRSKTSFDKGHIISSINVSQSDIEKHLKKLGIKKDKAIVLVDDNGSKTSSVATKLKTDGFTKIYTLAGGINSWKDAQLPLSKK